MPFLRILCPIKNKSFATSVETSIEHKSSLPNILKFSYCPFCQTLHGWSPDEAFFADTEHEAFLSEAINIAAPAGFQRDRMCHAVRFGFVVFDADIDMRCHRRR